tara:strand:- start:40 stop:606 length:567 start_codon:yes stop_codon:yes gene_type:complete
MSGRYNLVKEFIVKPAAEAVKKVFKKKTKGVEYVVPKTNIPKTNIQKDIRDLKIGNQKLKGKKAKLDQTLFEIQNPKFKGKDFTFKKDQGKSESKKESYDRIVKENTKVLKGVIDDAFKEKKAKGGRVGLKKGSFPDLSGDGKTTMKDILMARGVIPKNKKNKKKMMAKKFQSPMTKAIKKKDKKRII